MISIECNVRPNLVQACKHRGKYRHRKHACGCCGVLQCSIHFFDFRTVGQGLAGADQDRSSASCSGKKPPACIRHILA